MKLVFLVCVLFVFIGVFDDKMAYAGGLNRIGGVGPRSGAMSNAYTAIADDASVFYHNVAGLSQFQTMYLETGADFVFPAFKLKDRFGKEIESHMPVAHVLPVVGFVQPVSESFTWGIGIHTPFGLGARFDDNREQLGADTETCISLTNITPAVSYKLNDRIALGFGINIGWGQFQADMPLSISSIVTPIQTKNQADGFGVGWTTGVMWQISDQWRLGARYTSETTVDLSGDLKLKLGPFEFSDSLTADYTYPDSAAVGLAYTPYEKLTLAASANWTGYSSTEDSIALSFKKLGITKTQHTHWKDIPGMCVGVRYSLTPQWTVRAGIGMLSAAVPDNTVSTLTPDANGWDTAVGIEYQKGHFTTAAHVNIGNGENTLDDFWGEKTCSATITTVSITGSWHF